MPLALASVRQSPSSPRRADMWVITERQRDRSTPLALARSSPALTADMQRMYWGTVKLVVLLVEMPRAVSSSITS